MSDVSEMTVVNLSTNDSIDLAAATVFNFVIVRWSNRLLVWTMG